MIKVKTKANSENKKSIKSKYRRSVAVKKERRVKIESMVIKMEVRKGKRNES